MNSKSDIPTFTVVYAIRGSKGNEEVLLGLKTRNKKSVRMGTAGKLIGYGGGLESFDRSVKAGAIREFIDEIGRPRTIIKLRHLRIVASVEIRRKDKQTILLKVLLLSNYRGRPRDTREIKDARWYPARSLPKKVLPSDPLFFPRVLEDKRLVTGWMLYGKKMKLIDYGLDPLV